MPTRRPTPDQTACTMLRRHGDFAIHRVMELIRADDALSQTDAQWWQAVLNSLWALTADASGPDTVH